jgi:hypothetical protein
MSWIEKNRAKWIGVRPAREGTDIILDGTATNGTTVLYTVPAGKVFNLISSNLCVTAVGAGRSTLRVLRGGATIYLLGVITIITAAGVCPSAPFNPSTPMGLIAGDIIDVSSTAVGHTSRGEVYGWEEYAVNE